MSLAGPGVTPLPPARLLLQAAANDVQQTATSSPSAARDRRLHVAEQVRLLLRVAADTGARRGELEAL